jgi:hypothetical protein
LSVGLNSAPGGTATQTIAVYYTPKESLSTAAARFDGHITNTTLTVVPGTVTGTIAIGQGLHGSGAFINSYIVSGSGTSWTIYPLQTVGATGTPVAFSTSSPISSFTGTITNISNVRTLTISGTAPTSINVGQYVVGTGVTPGVNITAKLTDNTWVVTGSDNVSTPVAMYTNGMLSTGYSLTMESTDTSREKYDASFRFDTGDRIHVYSSYTGTTTAHDMTVQLDMF